MNKKWMLAGGIAAIAAAVLLAVGGRSLWVRFLPIHHTGEVKRIQSFHKGGMRSTDEGTAQLRQFAIIFTDGFICEGYDTALAAVKVGDVIEIKAYHDVKGWPVIDPEWWECEEGQLVRLE